MFDPSTRILVVDDMMTMRKLVMKSMNELGFTDFTQAYDGGQGYQALTVAAGEGRPIGLVISDWNMPNTTGLDLLKRVRADGRFRSLPFILVTAEAEQGQIVEAVKAGVSNYVVKPFTTDILRNKIEVVHKKIVAAEEPKNP